MKKNNYILIGYVNQFFTKQLNLALINTLNNEHIWIYNEKIEELTKHVHGIAGIKKIDNKYLIAYQAKPVVFIFLNADFSYHSNFTSSKIIDVHSISFENREILVSSTGNNSVYKLILNDEYEIEEEQLFWKHNSDKSNNNKDLFHVNSICHFNNKRFVSCFGHSPENKQFIKKNLGEIINIDNNEVVYFDLNQPHTLTKLDDEMFFCESGSGILHSSSGIKIEIGGYIRGIAYDDKFIYLGRSGKRIKSKSTNKINLDSKKINENAEIVIINRKNSKIVNSINLGNYGNEIYDLVKINNSNNINLANQNNLLQIKHLKRTIIKLSETKNQKSRAEKIINTLFSFKLKK